MKTTKLSLLVGLGIFFIVTVPIHAHYMCKVKLFGTTNEACPHPHRAPEATSRLPVMEETQEDINRERRRKMREKQKKQAERDAEQRKQVYQKRKEDVRRAQEEERIYQEHRVYEQKQRNERISRKRRRQEQDALRNIDRGGNNTSQPTKNEEIMRAEDNFERALRNARGQ